MRLAVLLLPVWACAPVSGELPEPGPGLEADPGAETADEPIDSTERSDAERQAPPPPTDPGTEDSTEPTDLGIVRTVDDLSPGDLVITEFMQRTRVLSIDGQWFEVYNATQETFDLEGLVVTDDGPSDAFTVSGSLISTPGSYLVFGINGDQAVNGGVAIDYDWPLSLTEGVFFIFSSNDEIVLARGGPNPIEIDRIELPDCVYSNPGSDTGLSVLLDDCFFQLDAGSGEGVAHALDSTVLDAVSNDDITSWCSASTPIGIGSDLGTPGSPNLACP